MIRLHPRYIIGKRVKDVRMNPFPTGRTPNPMTFNPVIEFEDGSCLSFDVNETESMVYGIEPIYWPKGRSDNQPIEMTIAKRLRMLRAALNLTQQQMADRLGVSFATVNRLEGGHTQPQRLTLDAIQRLAKEVNL